MQKSLKSKRGNSKLFLAAAGAVAGIGAFNATTAHAVTLTLADYQGQISNNSTFSSGYFTNVTISGANPTVTVPLGDYFRFSVQADVTNNSNPASQPNNNTSWDYNNYQANSVHQPANLGLSALDLTETLTNNATSVVAPVSSSGLGTEAIGTPVDSADPSIPTAASWGVSSKGGVSAGTVGVVLSTGGPINVGSSPTQDPTTNGGVADLAAFAQDTSDYFFQKLTYSTVAAGTTTITPTSEGWGYWANTYVGDSNGGSNPATYSETTPTGSDVETLPAAITIDVTAVPEPASVGVVALASAGLVLRRRAKKA